MSIDFESHPGIVLLRPSGPLTVTAALGWADEIEEHPGYLPGLDAILDLSLVDASGVSGADIQRVVQGLRQVSATGPRRVAYVASGESNYGLLRMFTTLAGFRMPRDRGVFRSVDEALDWLAVDCPAH